MSNYLVNSQPQSTGEHEVHEERCRHLPNVENRQNLGWHADCKSAVKKAKTIYTNILWLTPFSNILWLTPFRAT